MQLNSERDVLARNRRAWDQLAQQRHVLTLPAREDELRNPLKTVDAAGWLGPTIEGWKVLCLAAGGGKHGPLYAAAKAHVTVVDLSPAMLALDQRMAQQTGLEIRTVETSMDNLEMLADCEFDLVVHPVSTCYLPSLGRLFREVARVTRPGGLYISQHKQPANLQVSLETYTGQYVVQHAYYDKTAVQAAARPSLLREWGTQEFVHTWADLLGGMCRAGFVVEDVTEPNHADPLAEPSSFKHRCHFIAPYLRIKAKRNTPVVNQLIL